MRWLLLLLLALVALLQYRLWFAEGSLAERQRLERRIEQAERDNARLRARNAALAREVVALQSGEAVVEQLAREELNLIRENEVFYQFLEGAAGSASSPAPAARGSAATGGEPAPAPPPADPGPGSP